MSVWAAGKKIPIIKNQKLDSMEYTVNCYLKKAEVKTDTHKLSFGVCMETGELSVIHDGETLMISNHEAKELISSIKRKLVIFEEIQNKKKGPLKRLFGGTNYEQF